MPERTSVIVGCQNARGTVRSCLAALNAQTTAAEIIVVDGSSDGTAEIVAAEFPQIHLLRCDSRLFVPHLWKAGLDQASGQIIAFTIAQCIPGPDWVTRIEAAFEADIAGVGGPLDAPVDGSAMDWAYYFVRYNAFLPPGKQGIVADIAGDNAAYLRDALNLATEEMRGGFWETLVHVRLRANGKQLLLSPAVTIRLSEGCGNMAAVRTRFWHGRHYGSTRPGITLTRRVAGLLASPLIAVLLLSRIWGRVSQRRPDWRPQFWRALPFLLLFVGAWTLGEASGYLRPQLIHTEAADD